MIVPVIRDNYALGITDIINSISTVPTVIPFGKQYLSSPLLQNIISEKEHLPISYEEPSAIGVDSLDLQHNCSFLDSFEWVMDIFDKVFVRYYTNKLRKDSLDAPVLTYLDLLRYMLQLNSENIFSYTKSLREKLINL